MGRKTNCKTTQFISTPIWAYVLVILCAVLFFGVSAVLSHCQGSDCYNWWSKFFLNIGYGAVASIIVTVLVDIGNTKRQQNKDKIAFDRLNAELKEICSELPVEMHTAVYEAFGYNENSKYTFAQWTDRLFSNGALDNPKQEKEICYVLQHISSIKKVATQIKSNLNYLPNNQYIDDDYEKKLGRLISTCSRITRKESDKDYSVLALIITQDLKKVIVDLYDELSLDYSREYNDDEYID